MASPPSLVPPLDWPPFPINTASEEDLQALIAAPDRFDRLKAIASEWADWSEALVRDLQSALDAHFMAPPLALIELQRALYRPPARTLRTELAFWRAQEAALVPVRDLLLHSDGAVQRVRTVLVVAGERALEARLALALGGLRCARDLVADAMGHLAPLEDAACEIEGPRAGAAPGLPGCGRHAQRLEAVAQAVAVLFAGLGRSSSAVYGYLPAAPDRLGVTDPAAAAAGPRLPTDRARNLAALAAGVAHAVLHTVREEVRDVPDALTPEAAEFLYAQRVFVAAGDCCMRCATGSGHLQVPPTPGTRLEGLRVEGLWTAVLEALHFLQQRCLDWGDLLGALNGTVRRVRAAAPDHLEGERSAAELLGPLRDLRFDWTLEQNEAEWTRVLQDFEPACVALGGPALPPLCFPLGAPELDQSAAPRPAAQ